MTNLSLVTTAVEEGLQKLDIKHKVEKLIALFVGVCCWIVENSQLLS